MGNRTALTFSGCCEFEANNCLPVTWLALFSPQDFLVEKRHAEDQEYEVASYRTVRGTALKRVEQVLTSLRGQTPAWAFLRPIEVLKDELDFCSMAESIEIDVSQFWAIDQSFQEKVANAVEAFDETINAFVGDSNYDISLLDKLINEYAVGSISTVTQMNSEERMFLLLGTYWGSPDRERLFTLKAFDENYWRINS